MRHAIPFFFFIFLGCPLFAQKVVYKGRVTDAETGEGIPFVNVFFEGTQIGANTDFDGFYQFSTQTPKDTLVAKYIGYRSSKKAVGKIGTVNTDFQLKQDIQTTEEVLIVAGENPSWRIMREAVAAKDKYDKRNIPAYEFNSYNKLEADMDNIPDRLRKTKIMRKIEKVLESADSLAGDDGQTLLPFFVSESLSKVYVTNNPQRKKEYIEKTNVSGIGLDDGSFISQLIGSTFQEYNFYKNRLNIFERDFVSPLSSGWKQFYEVYIQDTVIIVGKTAYQLELYPKRPQDLAFYGKIWIDTTDFALIQVDLEIRKSANLNYVEKFKIQQNLIPTTSGHLVPSKTRLVLDIMEVGTSAGILAKGYTSNRDYIVTEPKPSSFYDTRVELSPDVQAIEPDFWEMNRHDSLTFQELEMIKMIDTINNIPVVKSYVEVANILVNGYYELGKIDLGPYLFTYAWNDIEGHRIQIGGRTNENISRKVELGGYAAYGFLDGQWKYSGTFRFIPERIPWTEVGVTHSYELEQVAFLDNDFSINALFSAFVRFGTILQNKPLYITTNEVFAQREIFKFFNQKIRLRNRFMEPVWDFSYSMESQESPTASVQTNISTSELILESRYARNEIWLMNDNNRVSLGTKYPVFFFRYTLGLDGVLGGNFHYNKFYAGVQQSFPVGTFGRGNYILEGGFIPNSVPYPLLIQHLGNESIVQNSTAYNLMNYFEFVSDRFLALHYLHNFDGNIANRIPLLKKMKVRFIAQTAMIYGTASQDNIDIIISDENGPVSAENPPFNTFARNTPYAEVGYGIDNILTFLRVTAVHRLTYINAPNARRFGLFVSAHFKL